MKPFWALLRRDLAEWSPLWVAALVLGLVPVVAPALTSAEGEAAVDLRVATATLIGLLYGLAAVAMLGDGLAARDQAEGRLGFYLARPIRARTLWLARLAAALLLLTAIAVSLALPVWLVERLDASTSESAVDLSPMAISAMAATAPGMSLEGFFDVDENSDLFRWLAPIGVLGLLLSLLLVAHAVSTAARSRSAWTLLDVAGLSIVAVLLVAVRDVLLSVHAHGALVVTERLFVAALAAILAASGARQLACGRNDLVRGHGFLSRTAWPLLVLLALSLLAIARWVASPTAADLVSAEHLWSAPDGRYVAVRGRAAHRLGLRTSVIFSAQEPESTATVIGRETTIAASANGDRLAWVRCRRSVPLECQVWTWQPETDGPHRAGIFTRRWDHHLALSPGGELLALAHERLEVWQPDLPRLVFALDRWPSYPAFLSATRLRFLHVDPDEATTTLEEVDLVDKSVRTLAELPGAMQLHQLVTSPSGRYVLASSITPQHLSLVDTHTGVVHELRHGHDLLGASDSLVSARYIGDHHLYLLTLASGAELRLLRVDPHLLQDADPASMVEVGLPLLQLLPAPRLGSHQGRLLLSGQTDQHLEGRQVWSLDSRAVAWSSFADGLAILADAGPGEPQGETRLFVTDGGAVVSLADGLQARTVVPALPDTDLGRLLERY